MGAAIARKLAESGFKIAILSSSGRGEALAAELGGVGVTGSNQSPADLTRIVETAMDAFGRIDAVVNSASHGPKGKILEISDDDWHLGMEVYLLNVIRSARLVTPILKSYGGGAIINISRPTRPLNPNRHFRRPVRFAQASPHSQNCLPMNLHQPTSA